MEAFQETVKHKQTCRVGKNVPRREGHSLFKDSRKDIFKIIKILTGH